MANNKKANFDEIVTRFIMHKKSGINSENKPKYSVFMYKTKPELSVLCIGKILNDNKKIWDLASKVGLKDALARTNLKVINIEKIKTNTDENLEVVINGIPIPEHANIQFNPLGRCMDKLIAMKLSNIASKVKFK